MEKTVFSTNGAGRTKHSHAKKKKNNNSDTDFTSFTKMNSRWIVELHVKWKTTTILENNRKNLRWPWMTIIVS